MKTCDNMYMKIMTDFLENSVLHRLINVYNNRKIALFTLL